MSLKKKIVLMLLVSSVIPVLIIGWIETTEAQQVLEQQIGVNSLELARMTLERVNEYLHSEFDDVLTWSHVMNIEHTAGESDYSRISEQLAHMQETQNEHYYIIMSDIEGQIVASSDPELIGANVSGEPGFKEAVGGKASIQDVAFNERAGGWAMVISVPVVDSHEDSQYENSRVTAVLSATLKWDIVNEMIVSLKLAGRRQSTSDHFMLFNSEGLVISCFDKSELFTGNLIEVGMDSAKYASEKKEGFLLEDHTEHGLPSFSSYTYLKEYEYLPDFGWGLVLLQDPDRVFASINSMKRGAFRTLVFCVAILFVLSLAFAGRITKPILAIASAAGNLGNGQLDTRVSINSRDELGTLASSFNTMAEELQQSDTRLRDALDKRKQAEEALEASNYDLNLSVSKLEKANMELTDFVYIASHDLREPLRKISSFGELLKDSLRESIEADDRENLDFMIDGAERMTQMIEGLLTYSRLDSKKAPFGTVDLNEIVHQLRQLELAAALEDTDGAIEVPLPLPTVRADSVQISQLLQNIIANAIKYRCEETSPRIVITATRITDDEVRIEVRDNGIGIKQELHEDVFKMFKRVYSRQKYEGTGIGLAVCRKIVDRHGGQIGVDSAQGRGSTFWFTLTATEEPLLVS